MSETKTTITPVENGPLIVEGLVTFRNSRGELEAKPRMALCRCGASAGKPFCDGTHAGNGFSSAKADDRRPDQRESYSGEGITIHDNRGVCAHAGVCTESLPSVWRMGQEPWIDPNGAAPEEIAAVVRACPSGALADSIEAAGTPDDGGVASILVAKDGPLVVAGGADLVGETFGDGASRERFTLCRCGSSANKPFCDGSHWRVEFADEKN